MRRILFLDHSGGLGGAELYLKDLLRHFKSTSHAIIFQQGSFPERLAEEKLPYSILSADRSVIGVQREGALSSALRSAPSVLKLVKKLIPRAREYDVLYANSQKAFIVAGLVSLFTRRPLIWNLHDILTAKHFSEINRRTAVLWSNLFAHHVVTNSYATLDAYRSSGGRAPASVVYNGIDVGLFDQVKQSDVRRVRNELGLGSSRVVGIFSRLASWKGQHVLIEALRFCPDYEAVIVGDALFQEDVAYKNRLQNTVARYGLGHRVHFLGFRRDIPTLMKAVDVVAHTSTAAEPFGRVVVEGMLAGKPVIAMGTGGPREIIRHGETGLLMQEADPKEMAEGLRVLSENADAAKDMARAGRSNAQSRFSIDRMCSRIEEIVQCISS